MRLLHRLGYRGLGDWRPDPAAADPTYHLRNIPRPGWYLLSLRLDAEQSRCLALCNSAQAVVLPRGRLRRRVVRIRAGGRGFALKLLGMNGAFQVMQMRLAPLPPGRLRWLLARKLLRLHPGYSRQRLLRRSLPRQWRDYNRLLARRSAWLLLYDDWLAKLEAPALIRERHRLATVADQPHGLHVMPWSLPHEPLDPEAPSLATLNQQWPGPHHLLPCNGAEPAGQESLWVLPVAAEHRFAPQALHRFRQALRWHPQALVLYADEDMITSGGRRHTPRFRPAWNPDLLLSDPEFSHCWLIRADLWSHALRALACSGQLPTLHALVLEATARCGPEAIVHLPEILLHRLESRSVQPRGSAASAAAVEAHLRRRGHLVRVEARPGGGHRLHWPLPAPPPLVSVIIPTRDRLDLLSRCLETLRNASAGGPPCEWLVIDNGSREPATLAYLADLEQQGVRLLRRPGPFNYAALNNEAAALARGDLLAFLNNDVEAPEPGWLAELAAQALRPGIGAVGARLLYPDGSIQHAGVVLGIGGVAGHAHKYLSADAPGYELRLRLVHNVSAVTGAALVIRRDLFNEVGGFDAELFAVNYNDVDLCLRLMRAGYRNLYCPDAVLIHHESRSRGVPTAGPAYDQWQCERSAMLRRWGALLEADPHYSPHLSLHEENFSLALRQALPPARSGSLPWAQI
jgi:GT2 family glycosyltransferase